MFRWMYRYPQKYRTASGRYYRTSSLGEDINSFTPVQHPANDMTTDIITTHFDYHSIDHNLLKLDILGHDDPTMIKTLEEYISSPAMDNEYNETDHHICSNRYSAG